MRPVIVVAGLLTAALVVSPPWAWAEQTAAETIASWQAQGYTVNLDRIGSAPLDRCVVTGVRNPQRVTRWIRVEDDGWNGHDSELVEVVVSRSVSVSLDCAH